jgi:hypothetical protein
VLFYKLNIFKTFSILLYKNSLHIIFMVFGRQYNYRREVVLPGQCPYCKTLGSYKFSNPNREYSKYQDDNVQTCSVCKFDSTMNIETHCQKRK